MPNQFSKLLMDDSFVRFLKGKASKEEVAYWTEWMQANSQNAQSIEKGKKLLNKGTLNVPKPNSNDEFNRLLKRIESQENIKSIKPSRNRSRNIVWLTMAAAICLLLLTGYLARNSFLQNSATEPVQIVSIEYKEFETETGQKTTVQYSDGSIITLNANSKIRLPQKMVESDTMQVWLEGEALFNITRKETSESRTFIVHTPDGSISVLGTRFSVNTTKNQSQVVLTEGSVKINVQGETKKPGLEYVMSPGEKALFSQNSENIQVEQVNTEVYTSWAGNNMVLDKTPLSDLITRIEFTYDVEVIVEDQTLSDEKLTGRFNSSDLSFLLSGLSKMLEVDIDQQDQTVYIKEKTDSGSTE
ncbi:FecR family protein [Rhodohalobacter sp.]|uniref:FecR family protein n=1 Tax=Rhodohalobacter sp. TaxID=1974210 RepID=UPI003565FC24